jgi:hypothetical protein
MIRGRPLCNFALTLVWFLPCLLLLWLDPQGARAASQLTADVSSTELISGTLGTGAISDQLSADGAAVEITNQPPGTTYVHVAVMTNLAGEAVKYLNLPGSQTRYVPPAGLPVVDMQALSSSYAPIGGWAGRLHTTPAQTGESPGSLTDRLSPDGTAIEVVSEPAGTAYIHVGLMANLAGAGIVYLNLPASQTRYVPLVGLPVVDMEALSTSNAPIGGWAGRLQVQPHAEEEPHEEEHAGSMSVGLDAGGWDWESAVRDFSGATRYVRSSHINYESDGQVALLARFGVRLMPLFNTSPFTASRGAFAAEVLAWFQRYGHGGTFWRGRTDLGATTAEIVNEPGNPYFWGSGARTDQAAYASLVEGVASALRALPAADRPRLLVSFDGGFEGDSYGRELIRADPHLLRLGIGWTVHPYGGHSSAQSSGEGNRSRVTEAHTATRQTVFVTEVGWPTAVGQPPTGDSLQWSEAQQAANIRSFVEWARGLGYVGAVVDFNYADYGSSNWYGIVDSSGTRHKLSYATLASLSR